MSGTLIVTARIGPPDFAWLDGLRQRHYPPERNRVPAHLTLLKALPPSAEGEVRRVLATLAVRPAPAAMLADVMELGAGVAFRVRSPDLDQLRNEITGHFHGLLSAPDRGGWVPHVTVQNKVSSKEARALLRNLRAAFLERPLAIGGLQLFRYLDGDWKELGSWSFRGVR